MAVKKNTTVLNFFLDCNSIKNKFDLDISKLDLTCPTDITIEFSQPIIAFRSHNYQWVSIDEDRISNDFSPKVIQLQNNFFVQANQNYGIWEFHSKKPTILLWRFNPEYAAPITQYSGQNNSKKIISASSKLEFQESLSLLISKSNAIEISRSPIPFSAIACFTDHCDYDTAENLITQREFFKKLQIKITKGFFINHFSKRMENASYQNDADELLQWKKDGHEMCYHSLTQSIRSVKEALNEFETFVPPFNDSKVWIDHGFQPYNLSLFEKNKISKESYEKQLVSKNIEVLWNYIDAGTATKGVFNQLNTSHFNLEKYYQSLKSQSFLKRMVFLIKSIIFHYDNDEFRVRNYIDALACSKAVVKKKKILEIGKLIKNLFPLVMLLFKVFFTWKSAKKTTFKMAKYSPLFFKYKIHQKEFYVFQTIEMVDFTNALCRENINSLIEDSGIFVAHTYFSVNMNHYSGKLINSDQTLNAEVVANFQYLSEKIAEKSIWNPTLSELLSFYKKYQETIFDIDKKGAIFIKNNFNIPSRTIQ